MRRGFCVAIASCGVLVAGCVSVPDGPSEMVLPGSGKSFEAFRGDDYECRQFAHYQIGGKTADQAAANSGIATAAVGTVVGAAAGAAINGGTGAAVGAGAGLAMGSLVGADAANSSAGSLQRRYDIAYQQCMYAKGNKVPVVGNAAGNVSGNYAPRRPVIYQPPPPPPGWYPPPPPPR
jgi:hypothetical protein